MKTPEEYGYKRKGKICLFKKGPLSQWWGAFDGQEGSFVPTHEDCFDDKCHRFNCAEQWMMTAKAVVMDDEAAMKAIMAEPNPEKQKVLGRAIKNFDAAAWDKHKHKAVYYGNLWKFTQNQELKDFLLSFPRHTIFGEASNGDSTWGIGLDIEDPRALVKKNWKGKNMLGRIIQQIHRELLKKNM